MLCSWLLTIVSILIDSPIFDPVIDGNDQADNFHENSREEAHWWEDLVEDHACLMRLFAHYWVVMVIYPLIKIVQQYGYLECLEPAALLCTKALSICTPATVSFAVGDRDANTQGAHLRTSGGNLGAALDAELQRQDHLLDEPQLQNQLPSRTRTHGNVQMEQMRIEPTQTLASDDESFDDSSQEVILSDDTCMGSQQQQCLEQERVRANEVMRAKAVLIAKERVDGARMREKGAE